jgi:hypothetical protein
VYASGGYDVGVSEERYCSNCRGEIPKGAVVCPVCGVYAGDLFDGKKPKSPRRYATWTAIVVVLVVIALIWTSPKWLPKRTSGRAEVHRAILRRLRNEAQTQLDTTRLIRRRLVADGLPDSCIALVGKGRHDSHKYLAIDICHDRPMGEWTADPDTGVVTRLK